MAKEADKSCKKQSGKNGMDKSELRRQILSVRDRLEPEVRARYDEKIRERVFAHPVYRAAQIILAYAGYRSEVDTAVMIRRALDDGKYVFAPKVCGTEMEFWQITSPEDLHSGYKGIPEPVERVSFPEWIGRPQDPESKGTEREPLRRIRQNVMLWMPGAVFDRERNRIGYGKGFYDRYLGRLCGSGREKRICGVRTEFILTTAALAYTCQLVQELSCEAHDVKPDMVITEVGIL